MITLSPSIRKHDKPVAFRFYTLVDTAGLVDQCFKELDKQHANRCPKPWMIKCLKIPPFPRKSPITFDPDATFSLADWSGARH